jgi:hypothetical protein
MGFRFRKSLKVLPGLRINLSKSGASLSVGQRGATVNINPKGARATVGVPRSGLSYSSRRVPWTQKTKAPKVTAEAHQFATEFTKWPREKQLEAVRTKLGELAQSLNMFPIPTMQNDNLKVSTRLLELAQHPQVRNTKTAADMRAMATTAEELEAFLEKPLEEPLPPDSGIAPDSGVPISEDRGASLVAVTIIGIASFVLLITILAMLGH